MLTTIIRKDSYQDSITLMLLTNHIAAFEGVRKVSIMMGTPANKDILTASGLGTPVLADASANDIAIVMDLTPENGDNDDASAAATPPKTDAHENAAVVEAVLAGIDEFLAKQGQKEEGSGAAAIATGWEQACQMLPDANLALFSIPGRYVETEVLAALDAGMHAFIFSDNVPLEAEKRIKTAAAEKGLLVMGPDCGTAIINGVPLAFANVVPRGNIGIVGASGTGIQEVSCQIARLGAGISHAIGTGGRDVCAELDALTMRMGIAALEADVSTEVIVIVSKPPAPKVFDGLLALLQSVSKPVVAHFVGTSFSATQGGVYCAHTLEETARIAVELSRGATPAAQGVLPEVLTAAPLQDARGLCALYAGGTLASEAAVMIERALGIQGDHSVHVDGFVMQRDGFTIIDLGDDVYTQGKPHPMIAPGNRAEHIQRAADDAQTGIVLLDFVLGFGAHDDVAGQTVPAINAALKTARSQGRDLRFIASICGTNGDPQGLAAQKALLEDASVLVAPSNASAVATALSLLDLSYPTHEDAEPPNRQVQADKGGASILSHVDAPLSELLKGGPRVINVGLRSFTRPFEQCGVSYVQYDWQPLAGGDLRLQQVLSFLNRYQENPNGSTDTKEATA